MVNYLGGRGQWSKMVPLPQENKNKNHGLVFEYTLFDKISLRVQNEQFSEEKGFILRYTEKEV